MRRITDHYFEQYSRFGLQYPKSAKRYSTFKIDDLNHPDVDKMVIEYFKEKTGSRYTDFATVVLDISFEELHKVEIQIERFNNR